MSNSIYSQVPKALNKLAPGASWTFTKGDSLAGLVWLDESISRPSDEAITAQCQIYFDEAPMRFLKEVRNDLLRQCDWVVTKAMEEGTEVPANWKAYRKALRDLPANTPNPQYGPGPNELINVNWPTKPQ